MCGIRLKYHSSDRLTDRIIEGLTDDRLTDDRLTNDR